MFLQKFPNASTEDIKTWIKTGVQDIWPIENVWAIVKAKIDKTETTSLAHLKRKIVSVWREIDADKDL